MDYKIFRYSGYTVVILATILFTMEVMDFETTVIITLFGIATSLFGVCDK